MKPTIRVFDEGEYRDIEIRDWVFDRKGRTSTITRLLDQTAYLAEGRLEDAVDRQQDVVERALEEDVFVAKVNVPGWFVNGDDELSEEYGNMHPGDTLEIVGLVENYSEKAFRIVAKRVDNAPGLIYDYAWTFVPKSVVTVIRLVGVDSLEQADKLSKMVRDAKRDYDEAFDDMSWDEKLDEIDKPTEADY